MRASRNLLTRSRSVVAARAAARRGCSGHGCSAARARERAVLELELWAGNRHWRVRRSSGTGARRAVVACAGGVVHHEMRHVHVVLVGSWSSRRRGREEGGKRRHCALRDEGSKLGRSPEPRWRAFVPPAERRYNLLELAVKAPARMIESVAHRRHRRRGGGAHGSPIGRVRLKLGHLQHLLRRVPHVSPVVHRQCEAHRHRWEARPESDSERLARLDRNDSLAPHFGRDERLCRIEEPPHLVRVLNLAERAHERLEAAHGWAALLRLTLQEAPQLLPPWPNVHEDRGVATLRVDAREHLDAAVLLRFQPNDWPHHAGRVPGLSRSFADSPSWQGDGVVRGVFGEQLPIHHQTATLLHEPRAFRRCRWAGGVETAQSLRNELEALVVFADCVRLHERLVKVENHHQLFELEQRRVHPRLLHRCFVYPEASLVCDRRRHGGKMQLPPVQGHHGCFASALFVAREQFAMERSQRSHS
mmetsp:Transcript_20950/g.67785  ORF Transcript_20950/g.67785 Transcript_20950/m.67785 type:complete len:475 (-) Transcript_20950:327-1751(-)